MAEFGENGSIEEIDCLLIASKLWYLCSGSIVRRLGSGGAVSVGVLADSLVKSLRGGIGGHSRDDGRGGGTGGGGV